MAVVKAKGNMYPWVTHLHTHLRGKCSHGCEYCYVQAMERRYGGGHYSGPLRLSEKEFACSYDTTRIRKEAAEAGFDHPIIFEEHCNDLFQEAVETVWIDLITGHCRRWPENVYVFQTRNTERAARLAHLLPEGAMLGTTIETNRQAPGNAPHPKHRALGLMRELYAEGIRRFVTIEPILDFDVDGMLELLDIVRPAFVNIGADSKGHGLVEPVADKVLDLIDGIRKMGVDIRQKTNLERILEKGIGKK